jgi:hypothetical protein
LSRCCRRRDLVRGWSRDVSEDIAYEVLDQAHDADETLTDGTKSFIDHHVTPGEKRPSVRRGVDQAVRRKAMILPDPKKFRCSVKKRQKSHS